MADRPRHMRLEAYRDEIGQAIDELTEVYISLDNPLLTGADLARLGRPVAKAARRLPQQVVITDLYDPTKEQD